MTRTRRWVVRDGRRSLEDALQSFASDDGDALNAGRVFVNGRRSREGSTSVDPGDVVEVAAPRSPPTERVQVISSRDGLVVVDKPAGIPTEPDRRGGRDSAVEATAQLLELSGAKLHAASRLDLGVSGVVLLAASREARRRVAQWRRAGRLLRRYVALGCGTPAEPDGIWEGAVVEREARPAATRYRLVATANPPSGIPVSMLALQPVTGRFHQLRIHCARAGMPLLGDPANGGPRRIVGDDDSVLGLERVGLHSLWVEATGSPRWVAPVPELLARWWKRLGGQARAWSAASECVIP